MSGDLLLGRWLVQDALPLCHSSPPGVPDQLAFFSPLLRVLLWMPCMPFPECIVDQEINDSMPLGPDWRSVYVCFMTSVVFLQDARLGYGGKKAV